MWPVQYLSWHQRQARSDTDEAVLGAELFGDGEVDNLGQELSGEQAVGEFGDFLDDLVIT